MNSSNSAGPEDAPPTATEWAAFVDVSTPLLFNQECRKILWLTQISTRDYRLYSCMKKILLLTAVLVGGAVASQAGVRVGVGVGIPLGAPVPVFVNPPPVVYQVPAPVYTAPPPVVYQAPPPVVYAQPPVVYAPPRVVYASAPSLFLGFGWGHYYHGGGWYAGWHGGRHHR